MALTILRQHEAEISKIDDPLEVFQVVQVRKNLLLELFYFAPMYDHFFFFFLTAFFFLTILQIF